MQRPSSSGKGTVREELAEIERLTGWKQSELDLPGVPFEFYRVYSHSNKISEITDRGILAYTSLMDVKFTPDEIEIIKDIDYIKRAVNNGKKPHQILELFGYG